MCITWSGPPRWTRSVWWWSRWRPGRSQGDSSWRGAVLAETEGRGPVSGARHNLSLCTVSGPWSQAAQTDGCTQQWLSVEWTKSVPISRQEQYVTSYLICSILSCRMSISNKLHQHFVIIVKIWFNAKALSFKNIS